MVATERADSLIVCRFAISPSLFTPTVTPIF
jgi:hypothetical protein